MAMSSSSGFEQWGYAIGRSRHGRHGKMDIRRGSSVRSDGIVLTMLLCSANDISAICSIRTKNITTRLGRTFRCRRTRRSRVLSRPSVARWRCQFWADCTTNISGRRFPTGTGPEGLNPGSLPRARTPTQLRSAFECIADICQSRAQAMPVANDPQRSSDQIRATGKIELREMRPFRA